MNGATLETAANIFAKVTSGQDGARLDLGNNNVILLEGINKDNLSISNFEIVEVLM